MYAVWPVRPGGTVAASDQAPNESKLPSATRIESGVPSNATAKAAAKLLAGFRGRGPYDPKAAARAIAALSRFGAATIGKLASIEINPLIVNENGAVGVDVLIEPVRKNEGSNPK